MSKQDDTFALCFVLSCALFVAYYSLAFFVFECRNPTANKITVTLSPIQVLTFQKLDKYQGAK